MVLSISSDGTSISTACEAASGNSNLSISSIIGNAKTKTSSSSSNSAKQTYSYTFDKGRVDKRVSLNVAPLVNGASSSDENFVQRVTYVLGQKKLSTKYVYGFLYGCLNKSCGLIFPYTPSLTFTHNVNYEDTEIIHSNLKGVSYKNTPPPSITLNATFTADTRNNALHMLSAIWFLRAVTKCDFGEQPDDSNNSPGMPPPVLYLNGYDQIMDNIPVVVKTFSYILPDDKDYVSLGINLNTADNKFIYTNTNDGVQESGNTLLNGIKTALSNITGDSTKIMTNGNSNGNYYFSNWLPTELKFQITLEVVPNLLKYKKQFDLNKYKMGIYNLKNEKGDLYVASSNGLINTNTCSDLEEALANYANQQIEKISTEAYNSTYQSTYSETVSSIASKTKDSEKTVNWGKNTLDSARLEATATAVMVSDQVKEKVASQYLEWANKTVDKFSSDILQAKNYNFDRSGWTW